MLGENDCLDIATDREISNHTHPTWREQSYQIVEDGIGCCLVTDLPVTVFIDIEFQTLQFDDVLIGHIVDNDGGKIWEARPGT